MTDKPIIIDDVDISECKYLSVTKSGRAQCMDYKRESNRADCKCNNNCYYKLLKHKEEECEELRDELEWVHGFNDQLKAELKEFKDMAKQGLDNYKDVGGCWGCGISFSFNELLNSYKELEKRHNDSFEQFKQLKAEKEKYYQQTLDDEIQVNNLCQAINNLYQAFQEMKEVVEDDCKTCIVKLFNEDEIECKRCYKTKILQKISEVLDE